MGIIYPCDLLYQAQGQLGGARVVICDVNQKAGEAGVRDLGTEAHFYREDIANAYLFLASDEASFISADVLRVDGGIVIGT